MRIIEVAGFARSGKDYVSEKLENALKEKGYKVQRFALADKLKEFVCILFNISLEELNALKNSEDRFCLSGTTMRQILQRLGTDIFVKQVDELFWIKQFKQQIKPETDFVILTDFRYRSEYESMQEFDPITLLVKGVQTISANNHPSENSLLDFKFDYVLDNSRKIDISEDISEFLKLLLG